MGCQRQVRRGRRTSSTHTAPELLAPAGGPDALRAAVAAGADAVYLGLGALNARAANAGFTLDELRRGCVLAHTHGVRVYVTLNAYAYDDELDEAVVLARAAGEAGADAFIVADAGLCLRLSEELPGVELHLSTQAGVQDAGGALLAARELGVSRVTCARELSLKELGELCAAGVPVEAFCHGAICICYSGACSFSAMRSSARRGTQGEQIVPKEERLVPGHASDGLRGNMPVGTPRRSANRGDCTQPCRIAHALVDSEGRVLAGGPDAVTGDRLLCPHDYLGIRHIPKLVRAGVAAFKIEGRMKNPDYVFNVVRCYRAALDAAAAGRELDAAALDELEAQLARSFNRGFTDAYLRGRSGAELMSSERAINQGLRVGQVTQRCYQEVVVAFDRAVAAGDTLEIRSTPGPDAAPDVPKRWPMVPCPADATAGEELVVPCKRKVEVGSVVYVVRSAGVLAAAAAAAEAMAAEEEQLCAGMPAESSEFAAAADGMTDKSGVAPLQMAGKPVEASERATHLFAESSTEAAQLLADNHDAEVFVPAYVLLEDPSVWESLIGRLTVILDEVNRASDATRAHELCECAAAVVCRNLGQIDLARAAGVPWDAAAPISVWNAQTARWLHGLGARRIWLPDELSEDEAARIAVNLAGEEISLVRGPLPSPQLMVTEHCLLTAEGPCAGDTLGPQACKVCPRRLASLHGECFLLESDGARLPVRVDSLGRTRIFATPPIPAPAP